MIGRLVRHRNLMLGGALTGLLAVLALVSLAWTPYPVAGVDVASRLQPPDPGHWLGTDHLGRDILSLIMAGARNSIAVGVAAVGIGLALGVPPGLLAAARGGLADEAVGRLLDVAFAFPTVLSAKIGRAHV